MLAKEAMDNYSILRKTEFFVSIFYINMLTPALIQKAVRRLDEAERICQQILQWSLEWLKMTVEDAYAAPRAWVERKMQVRVGDSFHVDDDGLGSIACRFMR